MWHRRRSSHDDKEGGNGGRATRQDIRVLFTILSILFISSTGVYLFYPHFHTPTTSPSIITTSSTSSYSRAALIVDQKQREDAKIASILSNLRKSDVASANEQSSDCGGSSSVFAGGVAGYHVFTNLWYRENRFYMFTDDMEEAGNVPDTDAVLSGDRQLVVRPLSAKPSQGRCFAQESILLNDQIPADRSSKNDRREYEHYHFAVDSILGGLASLSLATATASASAPGGDDRDRDRSRHHLGYSYYPKPKVEESNRWLIVPFESRWRDMEGLNGPMVEALFGERFVDDQAWGSITSNRWVVFSKVVIVDRLASARHNPTASEWIQTAIPILDLLSSASNSGIDTQLTNGQKLAHFQHYYHQSSSSSSTKYGSGRFSFRSMFEPYRQKMLSYVHLPSNSKSGPALTRGDDKPDLKPKIVFIDSKNSDDRLTDQSNEELIDVLAGWSRVGRAEIEVVQLERMVYDDQIAAFANADVVIGVHGVGLTHQLWMPAGGKVIEIFPDGVFSRNQQIVAQVLGHRYIAISGDRMLHQDEWEKLHAQMTSANTQQTSGQKDIDLDRDFFEQTLGQAILR
ncbi:hypothetical protein IAT40_000579 [Kwoniella sp. CBS 6097]